MCQCGGYWFPHRKGGGACDHSKTRDLNLAIRYGDSEAYMDAIAELTFAHPSPVALASGPPPF